MRAASPATNPVPANSAAGTTSHRARPTNAPTRRPQPHTTAARPSHCSGCSRPPLAWSIRAPTAATTIATPSVRRPRTDGVRWARRVRRTSRRAARRPPRSSPGVASGSITRPAGDGRNDATGRRAGRGCQRATASPTSRARTAHGPSKNVKPWVSSSGRPATSTTPPATRAQRRSGSAPTMNASHRAP